MVQYSQRGYGPDAGPPSRGQAVRGHRSPRLTPSLPGLSEGHGSRGSRGGGGCSSGVPSELYHTETFRAELRDLAAEHPDKLNELIGLRYSLSRAPDPPGWVVVVFWPAWVSTAAGVAQQR